MTALAAYLSYRDAKSALAWLEAVGFTPTTVQEGEGDAITHAELTLGDVVVMVASFDAEYQVPPLEGQSTGAGLYLVVDDVQAIYDRAVEAGATSVFAPEQTEWGTWRARVLDPEGREWSFGTYAPGQSW